MKNMMKHYLGNEYSENHLRNFCLYWMKAAEGRGDEWRKENDLDCLYFDGDLCADTLMSAWTPIKWVADFLNRDSEIAFYKTSRINEDPNHDLRLLAEDADIYLPKDNKLVGLLNRFLELAEQRCNFMLLPDRRMNPARYRTYIKGENVWLYDEVPTTLAHLFDKDSLGRFFSDDKGEINKEAVKEWIEREHLEMGFEGGRIDKDHVRPLIPGHDPYEAKWLTGESEICDALEYMIDFLQKRMDHLQLSEDCNTHNISERNRRKRFLF